MVSETITHQTLDYGNGLWREPNGVRFTYQTDEELRHPQAYLSPIRTPD